MLGLVNPGKPRPLKLKIAEKHNEVQPKMKGDARGVKLSGTCPVSTVPWRMTLGFRTLRVQLLTWVFSMRKACDCHGRARKFSSFVTLNCKERL
jgi:hypothetical protein